MCEELPLSENTVHSSSLVLLHIMNTLALLDQEQKAHHTGYLTQMSLERMSEEMDEC